MSMSSMIGPMGHAANITGLPMGKPKAKTHRGRKPSGKPGASHLAALQQAHGSGDLKAAKSHALNYAKAVHVASVPSVDADMGTGGDQPSADDAMAPVAASVAPPPAAARPKPISSRAMLAKLAMSRGKSAAK